MTKLVRIDEALRGSISGRRQEAGSLTMRTFRDCDALAEMTRREANAEFLQLSAGRFLGATTRLVLPSLRMHWTTTVGRTLNRCRTDPEYLYFHLPLYADEVAWDGVTLASPALLQHEGPDEFVRHAKDMGAVALAVRREPFVAAAAAMAGAHSEEFAPPRGSVPEAPGVRRLIEAVGAFGHLAARDPHRLERPDVQRAIGERVEHALLDHLAGQFGRCDEGAPPPGSRLRIVRRAEQALREAGVRRVALADLCRAAGVSRRTLQYAFHSVYGVSPLQYMQARQLAIARRALREAPPERGAVKRVAYEAGFTELGRFSVGYRRFFGESPSATLHGLSQAGAGARSTQS